MPQQLAENKIIIVSTHIVSDIENVAKEILMIQSLELLINGTVPELVQAEMLRRKEIGISYSGSSPFSSKIVCGCCGGYFGSKVWHSNTKYRKVIWKCNYKFQNGEKCKTPHFSEELNKKLAAVKLKIEKQCSRKEMLEIMMNKLESGEIITETYYEHSFKQLIDKITVHENETLTFRFLNGMKINK